MSRNTKSCLASSFFELLAGGSTPGTTACIERPPFPFRSKTLVVFCMLRWAKIRVEDLANEEKNLVNFDEFGIFLYCFVID